MKKSAVLSSIPSHDTEGSAKQCTDLTGTNANIGDSNNNSNNSSNNFYSVFQRGNKRASVKNIRDAFESAAAAAAKDSDHNKLPRQSNGVSVPQDRLLQSQTYIERLQRNLATKLSSATVEAFRRDYSPVRPAKRDDLKNNNELGVKERSGGAQDNNLDNTGKCSEEQKEFTCEEILKHSEVNNQFREIQKDSRNWETEQYNCNRELEQTRNNCEAKLNSRNCESEKGNRNCEVPSESGQRNRNLQVEHGCKPESEQSNQNSEVKLDGRKRKPKQNDYKCRLEECTRNYEVEQDGQRRIKDGSNCRVELDNQICKLERGDKSSHNRELTWNVERTIDKEVSLRKCLKKEDVDEGRQKSSDSESDVKVKVKDDAIKDSCNDNIKDGNSEYIVNEESSDQENRLIIRSTARARKLEFLNGPAVASSPIAGQSDGKQQRISWTTRLIQKLTEEEENAKKRVVKVVRPKRLVRFPQKKLPKDCDKSRWKPVPPPRTNSVPAATATEQNGNQQKEGVTKLGIKLDADGKDAYASLISQLVQDNIKCETECKSASKEKEKGEDRLQSSREDFWISSTSEDDDKESVIAAPATPGQGNPQSSSQQEEVPMKKDSGLGAVGGARGGKTSGIRRLLPTGLFSGGHNKNESSVTERLLKPAPVPTGRKVYPQQRPIVETVFLSSFTEPEKSRTRRSQSSSSTARHSTRRGQDPGVKDLTDVNQQQQRSKSVSPSRRSTPSRRTIPDTSLILEERLKHIRRELWQPRRPASTTAMETGHQHQTQNAANSPRIRQSKPNCSNVGRDQFPVVRPPADAYFHSPPSRRRTNQQQGMSHPNDQGTVPSVPQQRKTSSSTSSTSTIVPSPEDSSSSTSWNPLLQQAISGFPDIRRLQLPYRSQSGPYAVPVRTQHRSPEGLLQPMQNSMYNSPVPSGRLSAPPVPSSYYSQQIDVPITRSAASPNPSESSPRRALPHFFPPVTATIMVPSPSTSSQSSPGQQDPINTMSAQTQTTKSFIQQQKQKVLNTLPKANRLSRQEVEVLYWETQRLRAGLNDLSMHLASPQYATPVVKPQPVYNTATPRARSLSPLKQKVISAPNFRSRSLPRDNYFIRGTPQRNTIGPIRTSPSSQQNSLLRQQNNTPTIYEDPQEEMNGSVQLRNHAEKRSQQPLPIFKRGSLYSSTATTPVDCGISKRVSFGSFPSDYYQGWPTRNGPSSEPPTRQSRPGSIDSEVFLPEGYGTYANLPGVISPPPRSSSQQHAPNRPLPPVPDGESSGYAVVVRSPHTRWQQQSDTESGSEAGEVQRILQQGAQHRYSSGTAYFRFPPGADIL